MLELSTYYSGRLSYQEVEKLIERISGRRCLSGQRIWQAVTKKAVTISQTMADEVRQILQSPEFDLRKKAKLQQQEATEPALLVRD